jgi:hypothetical protein
MSLASAPFGFKPVRTLNGGDIRIGRYTVASTSARIFRGDVVRLNTLGLITRMVASTAANVIGVAAQDTGTIAGQITGYPVYDDPSTIFQVQGNNSAAITQAKFGVSNKFRIVATTGDTATGRSKEAVDIKTASASSATNIVTAIRLAPDTVGGNDLAQYSLVEVLLAGDPTKLGRAIE